VIRREAAFLATAVAIPNAPPRCHVALPRPVGSRAERPTTAQRMRRLPVRGNFSLAPGRSAILNAAAATAVHRRGRRIAWQSQQHDAGRSKSWAF